MCLTSILLPYGLLEPVLAKLPLDHYQGYHLVGQQPFVDMGVHSFIFWKEEWPKLLTLSYYFEIYKNETCFDDIFGSNAPSEDFEYSLRSLLCHFSNEWCGETIE